MLGKLDIKAQTLLLSAIIFILMLMIGFWGLQSIKGTKSSLEKVLVIRPFKSLNDTFDEKIENSLYKLLVGEISYAEAIKNLEEADKIIDTQWKEYLASGVKVPQESELASLIAKTKSASNKLSKILQEENKEAIREFINRDFPVSYEPLINTVNDIIDTELTEIDNNLEETSSAYASELVIFIVLAVILMIYSTWTILKRISLSLKTVSSQLKELASGEADLTKRIQKMDQKEIAEVTDNFNLFMEKLGSLVTKVKKSGTQVKATVETVASTSIQLENTIKQFDSSFSSVAKIANEISETTNILSKTISDVSQVALKTSSLAASSKEGLHKMEKTVANIEKATHQLSKMLKGISEKAEKITAIITSISKIANKTNILSLNFAILSEKAGEHGKSFGVIAREIRELAYTVEDDSKNIKQVIGEMKDAVNIAVVQMEQAYQEVKADARFAHEVNFQLSNIINEVEGLAPQFEIVNASVRAQVDGAGKVKSAISHFSEGIQETITSFEHINSVVKKLDSETLSLQQAVTGFKVD